MKYTGPLPPARTADGVDVKPGMVVYSAEGQPYRVYLVARRIKPRSVNAAMQSDRSSNPLKFHKRFFSTNPKEKAK